LSTLKTFLSLSKDKCLSIDNLPQSEKNIGHLSDVECALLLLWAKIFEVDEDEHDDDLFLKQSSGRELLFDLERDDDRDDEHN